MFKTPVTGVAMITVKSLGEKLSFSLCVKEYTMPACVLDPVRELYSNEDRGWEPHNWHYSTGTGSHAVSNYGSVEPSVSYNTQYEHKIIDFISSCIVKYSSEFPGSSCSSFSCVRFNRYEVGQSMGIHSDNIFGLFPEGAPRGVPVTSIVGLINKAKEGGKFIMTYPDGATEEFLKRSGSVLFFPSSFMYKHEVTPVLKGVRDSFVSWTHY